MRYRITTELNTVKAELSSGAIAAWMRNDVYDPPLYETGIAATSSLTRPLSMWTKRLRNICR